MSKIYYVTKYALTKGVLQIPESRVKRFDDDGWIWVQQESWPFGSWGANSVEWFETRAEADADVARRAAKKIASLKKQIAKLEKLAAPASSEKEG